MGVMECSRKGCTNIMCDKYSSDFGYICNDCYNEMVESGLDVKTFMNKPKPDGTENRYDYENVFTD